MQFILIKNNTQLECEHLKAAKHNKTICYTTPRGSL